MWEFIKEQFGFASSNSKKTLDSLLTTANQTINDLRNVAEDHRYEADDASEEIKELTKIVNENLRKSAHADIIADRMESFINVSEEELNALRQEHDL